MAIWSIDGEVEDRILNGAQIVKQLDGAEALVKLHLMGEFPGIGGVIKTYQTIPVAYRRDYTTAAQSGHRYFLKHAILKKLDDYFFRKERYSHSHITRPLGSAEYGYVYEWAIGSEGFPWEIRGNDGRRSPLMLDEFNAFVGLFSAAGVPVNYDITDPENAVVSKNIIHQLNFGIDYDDLRLNGVWKRIDFGERSLHVDYEKLQRYLSDNSDDIKDTLTEKRFDMMEIICRYLMNEGSVSERDIGRLIELLYDFRRSTLSHLNMRGFGPPDKHQ